MARPRRTLVRRRRPRPLSKAQRLARTPRHPRAAELAFALILRRCIEALGRAVLAMPLARYAHQDAADGGAPKIPAGAVIARTKASVGGASGTLAAKVTRNSKSEFKRLGISLADADEPGFGELIADWRAANVARATSLVEFERDELADILSKGANKTIAELREVINDRLEVSIEKADLLARDQVLKLNAAVTQNRQLAAGITEYIWTTSQDERVRDTHDELDGETFSWDDPPVTNDAGDHNHPGEDYQCRCVPYPVLPELEEDEPTS